MKNIHVIELNKPCKHVWSGDPVVGKVREKRHWWSSSSFQTWPADYGKARGAKQEMGRREHWGLNATWYSHCHPKAISVLGFLGLWLLTECKSRFCSSGIQTWKTPSLDEITSAAAARWLWAVQVVAGCAAVEKVQVYRQLSVHR